MPKQVLITGGAGFIGSHVADELLRHGYRVRALDSMEAQVHGERTDRPEYLDPDVELIVGDIRDRQALRQALKGVDAVYHFAAIVGVGQSMYDIARYVSVNTHGTAILLEELVSNPVERLIVASSMSVYGEGTYIDSRGRERNDIVRKVEEPVTGQWDPLDEQGIPLTPVPTPEHKCASLHSIYAQTKYDQEQMALMAGKAYKIPTVALRFFNAYGPRQALSNPYTGVLAIFASRLLNGKPPLIFEDGRQHRNFVHVSDISNACRLALEKDSTIGKVFNISSDDVVTVAEVAGLIARALGRPGISPEITGRYRIGDVRHCFADITQAQRLLGYEPKVNLEDGLAEVAEWVRRQTAADRVEDACAELVERGLAV